MPLLKGFLRCGESQIQTAEKGDDAMSIMIPSAIETISPGQIGKIQEDLGAALRKSGFPRDPVQQVIETQSVVLNAEIVAVIRRHVDAVSNVIVHRVKVDRSRTPQQALDATGRKQYTDPAVVETMPRGEGEEVDLYYFKPGPEAYHDSVISDDQLAKEYSFRGLVPDPKAQVDDNAANPEFADEHLNGTHWLLNAKWCYVTFSRWGGGRSVGVGRGDGDDWDGVGWWFAGVRKPA